MRFRNYFEREFRAAVALMPEVCTLEFEWDGGYDWTPEEMSKSIRIEMKRRRELTLNTNRRSQSS